MAAGTAGVQKSLDKIRGQVESGAFYEAQQMYKTVYHRYRARKSMPESYQVLQQGSIQQLRSKQVNCGIELAHLLIDAYKTDKVEANESSLTPLVEILRALPDLAQNGNNKAELEECSRFVMSAIKWAHKQGATQAVQQMHDIFAQWIMQVLGSNGLGKASMHFARGSDADAFADALCSCSSQAPSHEQDMFVSRAVFQTLACAHSSNKQRHLQHAQAVLEAWKQCQATTGAAAADSPLIHFTAFLLQALLRGSDDLLQLLRAKYAPSLERDPSFEAYLAKVEQVYFNIQPSFGGGGILGSLLKGLLEGESEDEDE